MSAVSLRRIQSQVSLEEGNYAESARHQIGGYTGLGWPDTRWEACE
jgi:hypothetical protein